MSAKPPTRPNVYAPGTQLVRDKTSYGLIPTPPSPTHALPGLMSPSNSTSNSSSSPPEPATPPRARTRYPDLGRVPLHRRGTSKTYERLEDLLKEAGYKETRVFTPETERSDSGDGTGGNQENRLSVRDGMDAVVGFFAGLLPGAMTSKTSLEPPGSGGPAQLTTSLQDYSPPVSPLTTRTLQRQVVEVGYDLTEPPTPTTMTSSIESLGEHTPRSNRHHDSRINNNSASTVNPHAPRTYHSQRPPLLHRTSSQVSHTSQQMQKQPSRSSLHHQAIQHHSNIVSPHPSRAGAYVRHVPSTSSMPPRPNSTPAHLSKPTIFVNDSDSSSAHSLRGEDSDQPPLPPSWLGTVARAVLFGGNGAYIGGPSNFIQHEPPRSSSSLRPAKAQVLRTTRSSLSQVSSRRSKQHRPSTNRRSGLSDQTNTSATPTSSRSAFLLPPSLVSQIERGRSGRSEGEVSKTRVVCRSAPGSRNGSVTRSGDNDDGKERWRKISRRKEEKGRLPSLARTRVEGDVWDRGRSEARTRGKNGGSDNSNRYLSGWGADANSEAGSSASSEEEEDGELDLARILVPPKRQNSIVSLRKHLTSEAGGPRPSAHSSLKNYAARAGSTGRRAGRGMNVTAQSNGGDGSQVKRNRVPSILQRRQQSEEDWDGESQEEWGGGWVRKGAGNRESEDDDMDSFVGFFGEGRTSLVGTSKSGGTGRNRLGFNGTWGLIGGNGS
ncbi:hypothetical protein BYT27DRAFT_7258995 [Phlegmacium glaucopus]|nr:hypothetical protein BYT27DRAFT_7258995 [Phlegmacium glaucopus]